MRRNLLLILMVFSPAFLFFQFASAQSDHYFLVPVDLAIGPADSTVEVDIHLYTIDRVKSFFVPLFAEGTSNPVLDTVLSGGLADINPPAFAPPSLVTMLGTKVVNPYGPPSDPLYFLAEDSVGYAGPGLGPYCKMFYKVSGPGTLSFRTAIHSTFGASHMIRYEDGDTLTLLNWPAEGQVGSYNIGPYEQKYYVQPVDLLIAPCDGGGVVEIDIMICTTESMILAFGLPLQVSGTANPVLDTALTGCSTNPNPPGFAPPSLAWDFTLRKVDETGPPDEPLFFFAWDGAGVATPACGLFCRMFYRVSGPGTIVIDTSTHPYYGSMSMGDPNGPVAVSWKGPYTFDVVRSLLGDLNRDGNVNVTDVVRLIQYLFKGGPPPEPVEVADANRDGGVSITDVVFLVNYIFKAGPEPAC